MFGEWLSLVEHLLREQGVGGSNPLSPTIQNKRVGFSFIASEKANNAFHEGGAQFESKTPTIGSAFSCSKRPRQHLRPPAWKLAPLLTVDCPNLPPTRCLNIRQCGHLPPSAGWLFSRPPSPKAPVGLSQLYRIHQL